MNPKVDQYLIDGCMRCKFGGTSACKVHNWQIELATLRQIILESGLTEEVKWGVPCYTFVQKNILLISALKNYCCLSFFKGSLLKDTHNILLKQGENSQIARIIKYNNTAQIVEQQAIIKKYILEAIELEKTEQKVTLKETPQPLPDELLHKFSELNGLKQAFFALTPGRQRGYIIYFSQPKQSQSRINRIEKCVEKILNGEGLNDKYRR